MKKTLLALSAIAMLGFAACNPNDDEKKLPNNGQYMPGMKIAEIRDNGGTQEKWIWNGNQLDTVKYYSNGQNISLATFTYDGGRLVQVTGPYGYSTHLNYAGDQLAQVGIQQDGIAGTFILEYSNGKVNKMTLPFSREMLAEMAGDELPEFITRGTGEMNVNLTWTGNNVSRQDLNATFNISITASELMEMAEMLGFSEMLAPIAPYASMLSAFQFPLVLGMNASTSIIYDNYHSPYQGYWGRFDMEQIYSIFSSNNPTSVSTNNTMNYSLSLPEGLPALLAGFGVNLADYGISFPITGSVPVDQDEESYSYQYNDKGYPTHITDDYSTEEIIYAE